MFFRVCGVNWTGSLLEVLNRLGTKLGATALSVAIYSLVRCISSGPRLEGKGVDIWLFLEALKRAVELPWVALNSLDILVLLGALLIIGPRIGVAEMVLVWERSSLSRDMKRLGQSPQVGMDLIAPGSFGLILGVVIGRAL